MEEYEIFGEGDDGGSEDPPASAYRADNGAAGGEAETDDNEVGGDDDNVGQDHEEEGDTHLLQLHYM